MRYVYTRVCVSLGAGALPGHCDWRSFRLEQPQLWNQAYYDEETRKSSQQYMYSHTYIQRDVVHYSMTLFTAMPADYERFSRAKKRACCILLIYIYILKTFLRCQKPVLAALYSPVKIDHGQTGTLCLPVLPTLLALTSSHHFRVHRRHCRTCIRKCYM